MTKIIHIFGNSLLENDNLAIKFIPALSHAFPDYQFIHQDPNDNLHPLNKELIIIDAVEGISSIKILHDIDKIIDSPRFSMHDLDLGFTLKLLKKLDQLDQVTIFCLPMSGDYDSLLKNLIAEIKKHL
ncbi:MAG: hypothetical protein WCG01_04280 [bacterium]